jgi:hypothetical protein
MEVSLLEPFALLLLLGASGFIVSALAEADWPASPRRPRRIPPRAERPEVDRKVA